MKLDNENDRKILLGLIQAASIQGAHVFMIADLVQRIEAAEIEAAKETPAPGGLEDMPKAEQGKVTTALL